MATKEFKGPVDCLGAALPDEEYFMLLARDPIAPWLVAIWASIRVGNLAVAMGNFQRMVEEGLPQFYTRNPDEAKSAEAIEVAERMRSWRAENVGGPNGVPRWKNSRAVGVERIVTEYVERRPGEEGGTFIRIAFDELPEWAQPLVSNLIPINSGGATDGTREYKPSPIPEGHEPTCESHKRGDFAYCNCLPEIKQ